MDVKPDILRAFRTADLEQQMQMLSDRDTATAVQAWLGYEAHAELDALSGGARHLSAGRKNLIFVPGVMGSVLQSAGEGGIRWLDMLQARDKLDELALAPGGMDDAILTAEIAPCAIDISYAPLRTAIAQSGQFSGSVQFPYDWRKPFGASTRALADLIKKVHANHGEKVHLLGHSMGGLMIRTALMEHGAELWPLVGKIVFIATPHYGSASIAGYLKNHLWGWEPLAVIGKYLSRKTFRSLAGVLCLLPAPASIYPGTRHGGPHPCANFDLYDAAAYKLGLDAAETTALQDKLDLARTLHTDLYHWHNDQLSYDQRQRMLQISGVGRQTLFRLETNAHWSGLWTEITKVTDRQRGDLHREGDGRVSLASTKLEKIECRYVKGEHGSLHNLPSVVQDVLAWLANKALSLPETPEAALSTHLAGGARSGAPHLDGSAGINVHDDAYDRYRELSDDDIQNLERAMLAGNLPFAIDLTHIL